MQPRSWTDLAIHPLRRLRERIEDPANHWHPIDNPRFTPEENPLHVVELDVGRAARVRFVYVIISWQERRLRKLAVSVPPGAAPPDARLLTAWLQEHLGFELAHCLISDDGQGGIVVLQRY
jgi:hypothetical protein